MNALHTEAYKGYTVTLEHDSDLQDPIHEYQDDYVLVSLHRRYGETRGFRMTKEFEDALRGNIDAVDGGTLENYGFE